MTNTINVDVFVSELSENVSVKVSEDSENVLFVVSEDTINVGVEIESVEE